MKILLTGGSGFLARGIMRAWEEHEFIVYSRDEYKQDLCKKKFPDAQYVLGDVKDYNRLVTTLKSGSVDLIIHTAAVKFIPEAEYNVSECIDVNIEGSRNVLSAAWLDGICDVVGISTDKACQPINTYGYTKAMMERLFIEQARWAKDDICRFNLVRYGNVIGSTGSVIPLFREQIKLNNKITITDPDMTRYWITINEALDLIKYAMALTMPGAAGIVIPKPKAMCLLDVAKAVASMSSMGTKPEIQITGPRAGEKRHEQLLHAQESVRALDYGTHFVLWPDTETVKEIGFRPDTESFILSSNTPEAGWLTQDEMCEAIEDAEYI